jgi:hypothetical protein
VLSREDHETFVAQGYVILKGAVPRDVCEAAVALLEAPEEERSGDGGRRQPSAEDGGADDRLAATLTAPILEAVAELFGPSNAFEYDPRDEANLAAIARRSGDFTRGGDFSPGRVCHFK